MNLNQLAKAHDIIDVKGLHDALLRARDTYFEAWFEDTQVGPDSLDKVRDHLETAWWELVDNPSNDHALRKAGIEIGELQETIGWAIRATAGVHQPKRRGPDPRKSVRALVSVLAGYWVDQLDRPFTQDWVGKGNDGWPIPATAATRFVVDVAHMIQLDDWEVPALRRACSIQVTTLREKG